MASSSNGPSSGSGGPGAGGGGKRSPDRASAARKGGQSRASRSSGIIQVTPASGDLSRSTASPATREVAASRTPQPLYPRATLRPVSGASFSWISADSGPPRPAIRQSAHTPCGWPCG